MGDQAVIRKNGSLADIPAMLRLGAAAGGVSLSFNPEMAIQLAHDLDQGRRDTALRQEAQALHAASREAVEAAQAAMQPIATATKSLWRLVVKTMLTGAMIGGLVMVALLDQLGVITW
ncbi:MAG: hypothetical protein ACOH2H_16085 [Cypionkella sp.]